MRQLAIQLRETQIVADRQSKFAPREIGNHRPASARDRVRLAIGFAARQIYVEEKNLVVARDDVSFRVEQKRAVRGFRLAYLDRQRSDQKPDAKLFGKYAKLRQRRIAVFGKRLVEFRAAIRRH